MQKRRNNIRVFDSRNCARVENYIKVRIVFVNDIDDIGGNGVGKINVVSERGIVNCSVCQARGNQRCRVSGRNFISVCVCVSLRGVINGVEIGIESQRVDNRL